MGNSAATLSIAIVDDTERDKVNAIAGSKLRGKLWAQVHRELPPTPQQSFLVLEVLGLELTTARRRGPARPAHLFLQQEVAVVYNTSNQRKKNATPNLAVGGKVKLGDKLEKGWYSFVFEVVLPPWLPASTVDQPKHFFFQGTREWYKIEYKVRARLINSSLISDSGGWCCEQGFDLMACPPPPELRFPYESLLINRVLKERIFFSLRGSSSTTTLEISVQMPQVVIEMGVSNHHVTISCFLASAHPTGRSRLIQIRARLIQSITKVSSPQTLMCVSDASSSTQARHLFSQTLYLEPNQHFLSELNFSIPNDDRLRLSYIGKWVQVCHSIEVVVHDYRICIPIRLVHRPCLTKRDSVESSSTALIANLRKVPSVILGTSGTSRTFSLSDTDNETSGHMTASPSQDLSPHLPSFELLRHELKQPSGSCYAAVDVLQRLLTKTEPDWQTHVFPNLRPSEFAKTLRYMPDDFSQLYAAAWMARAAASTGKFTCRHLIRALQVCAEIHEKTVGMPNIVMLLLLVEQLLLYCNDLNPTNERLVKEKVAVRRLSSLERRRLQHSFGQWLPTGGCEQAPLV